MSSMNFMKRLLDGVEVEWKALGDVVSFLKGKSLPKESITEDGDHKCVHYGELFTHYPAVINEIKSRTNQSLDISVLSKANDVLIPTSDVTPNGLATASCLTEDGIILGGDILVIRGDVIDGRYLSHFIRKSKSKIMQMVSGSTVYHIYAKDLGKLIVPIPCPENPKKSLEIQAEIVRILDAFTSLTAELTTELTTRKKQYNYYRDQLLSFEEGVPLLPLSQCCESITDGDHQAPQKTENGIPFITISDISATNQIDFNNTKFVSDSYYDGLDYKRKARTNDILYTVVGSFGIPVYIDSDKKFAFQRHIAILRPNPAIVISKYIYHALRGSNIVKQAHSVATGAAQKTITLTALNRMQIAVPSLGEQTRIVAILDKFDALTHSITEGLPREIELRQKQYEYYRDLLLSFPKEEPACLT